MRRTFFALLLVTAVVLSALPWAAPAQAVGAAVGRFWATCGMFSVDVAVTGSFNDGNNLDRFRYRVSDGTNKKLYQEDATRPIGVTFGSLVVNMSLDADGFDGFPSANPIKFQVLEVDGAGNELGVIQYASFDAPCLPASGSATQTEAFRPPFFMKGRFVSNSALYQSPAGAVIPGLTVLAGKEHFAVYRSADSAWVQIDVGGPELPWVPVAAMPVDVSKLNTPPTRIDLSDPTRVNTVTIVGTPVNPGTVVIVPGGVATGITKANIRARLRALPTTRSEILALIPARTPLAIFGRDASGVWIKVNYLDAQGWISRSLITLQNVRLEDLPVLIQ